MERANLYSGAGLDHRFFAGKVTDQALIDHRNRRRGRSGKELCGMFASDYRNGHLRMASGLYNKIRWSLDLCDCAPEA